MQIASDASDLPNEEQFRHWIDSALRATEEEYADDIEISLRLVDKEESRALNHRYRQQNKATDVLSFPFDEMDGLPDEAVRPLGDLVICAPVVLLEASEQNKEIVDHWAHVVIHGTLHLLGYDHQDDVQAATMETLETNILLGLGINNPYREI